MDHLKNDNWGGMMSGRQQRQGDGGNWKVELEFGAPPKAGRQQGQGDGGNVKLEFEFGAPPKAGRQQRQGDGGNGKLEFEFGAPPERGRQQRQRDGGKWQPAWREARSKFEFRAPPNRPPAGPMGREDIICRKYKNTGSGGGQSVDEKQ